MTPLPSFRGARRARLAAAALAGFALLLTGCAGGPAASTSVPEADVRVVTEAESGAFPVSIPHAFGTFELAEAPERIVTIGWATEDIAAALGVIPVAVPASWAGDDDGLVPWFRDVVEDAGAPLPVTLNDVGIGEIDFEQILELQPDAIIAPFSGITETQYKRLEEIAPTLAYPERPWFLDWQDHALLVGEALGRPAASAALVDDVNAEVADRGKAHPEFTDATFVYSSSMSEGSTEVGFYAPTTSVVGIVEDLGLTLSPDIVTKAAAYPDDIYFGVSLEDIDAVQTDVFIGLVNNQEEVDMAMGHTLFQQWEPIRDGHTVWLTDRTVSMAVAAPSVLSVPWVLDEFVPQVSDVLKKK